MDVSFGEAELAALCNSKVRLANHFGPSLGRLVGRRLLELAAAADLDELALLPGGRVQVSPAGMVRVIFVPDGIEVTGTICDEESVVVRRWRHQQLRVTRLTALVVEGSRSR